MKIALVNYRYFFSGGPERYYFNVKELLESEGHEIIPFSIKSKRNYPCKYDSYFIDAVDDEVYFAQVDKKNPKVIFNSFCRMFYSFEARRKFKKLLLDTHPDVIYIIQYHNKISPSILDSAKSLKIPVVHRISDFQYICPNALLYNKVKGLCEDCLNGKSFNCIKNKCVMDSYIYSAIKLMAKKMHDLMKITNNINYFVVPSSFTLRKLNQYGIPKSKLIHISTFFNLKDNNPQVEYQPYVLYVGRIEKEKGLATLINSVVNTDIHLKIIGFSHTDYDKELMKSLHGKIHHVEFLGKKDFSEIVPYLKTCLCTVVPSEWYDNFPNVILESFAFKKPVIATNIGSLPEMVMNGQTGLTFLYGDTSNLRDCIQYMLTHPNEVKRMGEHAFDIIKEKYSPEEHYKQLIKVLSNAQFI